MGFDKVALLNKVKDSIEQLRIGYQKYLEEKEKEKMEASVEKESPARDLIRAASLITELPPNIHLWQTVHVLKWLGDVFHHSTDLQR
jgi:hypothetical protein